MFLDKKSSQRFHEKFTIELQLIWQFSCHLDFTWNQFLWFWNLKICYFDSFSTSEILLKKPRASEIVQKLVFGTTFHWNWFHKKNWVAENLKFYNLCFQSLLRKIHESKSSNLPISSCETAKWQMLHKNQEQKKGVKSRPGNLFGLVEKRIKWVRTRL